jgi:hypothetical protein
MICSVGITINMQQGLKEILCARTTNCPSTVKHVIELSYFGFWITERISNFQDEFQIAKKNKIQKIQNPKKNKERKIKKGN